MAAYYTIEMVKEALESLNKPKDIPALSRIANKKEELDAKSSCAAYARPPAADATASADYLVVVGCRGCIKYMMVAKDAVACPYCGGMLLHFEKERCSVPKKEETGCI